jgi:hypothetical protein
MKIVKFILFVVLGLIAINLFFWIMGMVGTLLYISIFLGVLYLVGTLAWKLLAGSNNSAKSPAQLHIERDQTRLSEAKQQLEEMKRQQERLKQ